MLEQTDADAAGNDMNVIEVAAGPSSDVESRRRLRLRKCQRLAMGLLATALSTLLALLAGETYIRNFNPQVLFPRYVTGSEYGIRVNVPNARYWHTSPEMKAHFPINSMGIRSDREFTLNKPANTIRIIGLGDSFTQGYEVDLHDTYLYRLGEVLRNRGYPVEVINLGVSGHGTAEELILLKEFGFRFEPDIVILGYFQNDLQDNVRSRLYAVDAEGSLVRDAAAYLPAISIRNKLYSFWAYRWLAENSQLFSLARERLAARTKRKMVEANLRASPVPQGGRHLARLAARLLDEVKRQAEMHGAEFLLLDIPPHKLTGSNLPVALLERVVANEIVRPIEALRAEGPDAYLYRLRGHFHWTPRAHEIAATMLAEKLIITIDSLEPERQ